MENISGVINIYKEKGYTSHDVVNIVRKKLNKIKTGHTGTLDPDATGVLPICLGKATKLSDYISADIKKYTAVLTLGKTTDTQDLSGEILKERPVLVSEKEIELAVNSFKGEILQIPPMYSAIKINGKRLYQIARKGEEIIRQPRKVCIYDINIKRFTDNFDIEIDVTCSKGTYIRTLCNDIGEKLGCGGFMKELLRTESGKFKIENAVKLDELYNILENGKLSDILIPMEGILEGLKKAIVLEKANKFLYNGNKISLNYIKDTSCFYENEKIVIYDEKEILIGIYKVFSDHIKPLTMLL